MDDSSSDESVEEWTLYKDRPEWRDVTPVPQDDGPHPVVSIAYSEKFKDAYNYFRGVVAVGEKSARALDLTTDAITLNPANYTVWQYRRAILKEINYDLKKELEFAAYMIELNPKNYQVWHHRRVIVEWFDDGTEELQFTKAMLQLDAKNYHAWQHRQWALTTFKLFDGEMNFIEELLRKDVRNNSVWNHRYFVIQTGQMGFTPEVINFEVEYVINALQVAVNNESAWNYLRGVLFHCDSGLNEPKVMEFCTELYNSKCQIVHLLAFLADSAVELLERNATGQKQHFESAVKLLSELEQYDVIRASYWRYLILELQKQHA